MQAVTFSLFAWAMSNKRFLMLGLKMCGRKSEPIWTPRLYSGNVTKLSAKYTTMLTASITCKTYQVCCTEPLQVLLDPLKFTLSGKLQTQISINLHIKYTHHDCEHAGSSAQHSAARRKTAKPQAKDGTGK